MAIDWGQMLGGGLALGSGLFGSSGDPYKKAMKQYQDAMNQARQVQNPFYNAGTGAIPQYQQWLEGMKDPSGFINNIMGQYQESPWARFQQQQAERANTNAASASGLIGSTPYQQAGEQFARDISSQDMNNWLGQVLGINSQYGQGIGNMVGIGQNAANNLAGMYGNYGNDMAQAAYGREAGKQNDWSNIFGGAGSIISAFL